MRWSDERYVKVYTRDSGEWALVSWQAKGLFYELMRKCDAAGLIFLGRHGVRALASLLRAPAEEIKPYLDELMADGCIEVSDSYLVLRNFVAAQEATASDRMRKQHQRETEKARIVLQARQNAQPPAITQGECHEMSGTRTACHNQPNPTQPSPEEDNNLCAEPEEAPAPAPAPKTPPDSTPVVALLPVVGKGPKEYPVTEAKLREWQDAYPGVDVLREVKALVQWSRDNPAKRKTYRGAPAFFSRNLARKQDTAPKGTSANGTRTDPDAAVRAALAEAERAACEPRVGGAGGDGGAGRDAAFAPIADPLPENAAPLSAAYRAVLGRGRQSRELQDAASLEPRVRHG